MASGFIKLHRKIKDWGWYSDPVVRAVFIHLLITATYKSTEYLGCSLVPGQAIIGRKQLANELNLSEQQIRTALKKLESTGEISQKSTNKFTVVTIANWGEYQSDQEEATSNQPTNNHQITNNQPHSRNKEYKNTIKDSRLADF